MTERRQHYRVQAAFAENVSIQLVLNGALQSARAKDLSAGGMGVLVPISIAENVSLGSETELTFKAPWAKVLILKADIVREKFDETLTELGLYSPNGSRVVRALGTDSDVFSMKGRYSELIRLRSKHQDRLCLWVPVNPSDSS